MNSKVLIAYASKYGATREIAERIGAVLCQAGINTDVLPVKDGLDAKTYRAVILGSAVYVGKWPKEAEAFIKANEQNLSSRPVWLFSSGPTGEGDPVELVEGKCVPDGLQKVIARIHPRGITVFHGNIDPARVNPIEKWAIKSVVKKPFGDFRDWDQINAWASGIAGVLRNGYGSA